MTPEELAAKISGAPKKSAAVTILNTNGEIDFPNCRAFYSNGLYIVFGDRNDISRAINDNRAHVLRWKTIDLSTNSTLDMADISR